MDKRENQSTEEAKKEAARIIAEAREVAREIYGASLEYVDDMLSEVNLIVLRSKEMMRLQMESMMEEFDGKLDLLSGHKQEIFELLQEHTEEGKQPITKGQYEIRVDKPVKASYEIKIAEEWKERVENMFPEEPEPPQEKEEEKEGVYSAEDFNLDEEYFSWLEEQKKETERKRI